MPRLHAILLGIFFFSGCGQVAEENKAKGIRSESGITIGIVPNYNATAYLYLRCEGTQGFQQTKEFYGQEPMVVYSVKKYAQTVDCQLLIAAELYRENLAEARQFIAADMDENNKRPNIFVQALSLAIPKLREQLEQKSYARKDWLEIFLATLAELASEKDQQISDYLFIKLENYLTYVLGRTLAIDQKTLSLFSMSDLAYELGLMALLQSRCLHYQGVNPGNMICFKAAWDMVHDLDFRLMGEASAGKAFISFTQEVRELIIRGETEAYLAKLLAEVEVQKKSGSLGSFYVYSWTKSYLQDDNQALKYMATFFQDYVLLAQLQYLQGASFPEDKQDLVMKNIKLIKAILSVAQSHPRIMGDPQVEDIELRGDRGYHFFVPAYLAYKLRQRGYKQKWAAALPFIFNTMYEYARDINIDISDVFIAAGEGSFTLNGTNPLQIPSEAWQKFKQLLKAIDDPKSLSSWTDLGTLEDIYYGYAGAKFGANFPAYEFLSYADFSEEFLPAPRQFMEAHFF